MSKSKSRTSTMVFRDKLWEHIIKHNNIDIKNGSIITSSHIKNSQKSWKGKKNQFEPRILCKIDKSQKLPLIFKEKNLCLLSVKNGEYMLVDNIYFELNNNTKPVILEKGDYSEHNSLLLNIGDSETSMLDNLLLNGTLSKIIGEKVKYGPLLGGRHRAHFDTIIGDKSITINGSQYETDGCYETDNFICIVEAKSSACDNFNIRQLYYPYREVHKVVKDKKQIICLFIYKDKSRNIHIHKFMWNDYKKMLDIININYYQILF